ncbi:flavodoxin family protein [Thermococcus argininiproducens]|uniref:Flavodoxin family protein n=1 Tax=Thermococcus argininiproducens TaxID=2866384 RepID=A0A9E7MBA3_9EURY|nr:flavodoxin family protein [Thermococcus argininiproducens]USH00614.1 flavodoxin family protein [Thermococcus argininiproducens]
MNTLIIYVSIHHRNTEKVAKVMAKALDAELTKPWGITPKELLNYDLIGFGSGIYWWRHHWSLLKLVEELPMMKGKRAFIFSTAGMNIPFYNHRQLKRKLKEKGFEIVGEFSCRGWDTNGWLAKIGGINKGHPNESDLERAKKFAEKLRRNLHPSPL